MTARLDAHQFETAITWIPTVVAEHLGKDYRDEGTDRCWGSLRVCRASGAFYDFAAADGGIDPVKILQFLKKRAGEEWSREDAFRWWVKYLAANPGLGLLEAEDEEWTETRREATAALAKHDLAIAEPFTRGRRRGRVPALPRAPWTLSRGAIQSAAINSGKTAMLRLVCTLVRHGKIYGKASSAGIYRALSQAELTLCLDEVEFLRNDPYAPMMQVLDSSHHREDANILLTEPQKVGPPIARELSTWAAMALACNGSLPGSLQSRSLVVVLARAMADDEHEPLETRLTPELVGLRRELAAWAATITALPLPSRIEMPAEVYNRDSDNWRPIFAIARLAGSDWPERIREASLQALQTETLPTVTARLLSSIDLAFGDNPKPDTWLDTGELIARLVAQETEQWGTINRGRSIDAYWLRTQLRGLLVPAGAQQWLEPLAGGGRRHHRGYFYNQFADAFRRYEQDEPGTFEPGETHTEETPSSSGTSGTSGSTPKKTRESRPFSVPDSVPDDFSDPVQKKAREAAADEFPKPHVPDEPYQPYPSPLSVTDTDEWSWTGGAVEQPSTTEPEKPPENSEAARRPTARSRRAKPNGPVAESQPVPRLDMPEPSLIDYIEGSIAEEIRQLRAANPSRSIAWIAKQTGQPKSVVREILGNGEGAQ